MKKIKNAVLIAFTIMCMGALMLSVSIQSYAAVNLSKTKVSAISTQVYTGKAIKPAVTVKSGNKTLKNGTDYKITYSSNTNPGYATVKITGKGSYTGTKSVKFKIVSPKVSKVSYSAVKQTSVTLSWTASKKATGYHIYTATGSSYKLAANVRTTKYVLSKLSAGTTYKVKIRPYNKLSSGEILTGDFCTPYTVLTAPADVKSVTQTETGSSSATISWSAAKGASGYTVYFVEANGSEKAYKTVTATSCKITGITGDKLVKVAAYRTINGKKVYSAKSSSLGVFVIPNGAVNDLKASATAANSVTLKWTAVTGCNTYGIYKSTDGTNYSRVATVTGTTKKITGLSSCTAYFFKVYISVKVGSTYFDSAKQSNIVSTRTIPDELTGLTATDITNTAAAVSWNKSKNVSGYEIYLNGELYGKYTKNSFTLSGLEEKTKYTLTGRAYYNDGSMVYGKLSSAVEFTTDDTLVDAIKLSAASSDVYLGKTLALSCTVEPEYAADKTVTWSSSDEKVASIDAAGVVTPIATGSVKITATANDGTKKAASYTLTVKREVAGLSMEATAMTMSVGEQTALTYEITPWDATDKSVKFTSGNTSVLTVSESGLITAKAAGKTTVTVTSKEKSTAKAVCTVTVKSVAVTAISVEPSLIIYAGQSYTFVPSFTPANASDKSFTVSVDKKTGTRKSGLISKDDYSYTTSSYLKATSAKTGITGVKATSTQPASFKDGLLTYQPEAPGTFTVTVSSANGKTAKCEVTVIAASKKVAVTGVTVSGGNNDAYYPGKTVSFSACVKPDNATDTSVKWSSSNKNVAVVDNSGNVICVSVGTATITATSVDGSKKGTKKITVVDRIAASKVILSKTEIEAITVGEKTPIEAVIYPENANESYVTWSSSNEYVATVNSGNIEAKKAGTAVLTAKTANGIYARCTVHVYNAGIKLSPSSYYENCKTGDKVQLSAVAYIPKLGKSTNIRWSSDNEAVATVNGSGLVEIVGEGKARITAVCRDNGSYKAYAGFTTGQYTAPSVTDKDAFLNTFKSTLNAPKQTDFPEYRYQKSAHINSIKVENFKIDGILGGFAGAVLTDDDINEIVSDMVDGNIESNIFTIPAPITEKDKQDYVSRLPVGGTTYAISDALPSSAIKSCSATSSGELELLSITLNDEKLSSLPKASSASATNHGKVFDLFCKEDLDSVLANVSTGGLSVTYTGTSCEYTGSSVLIAVDKYSEKVTSANYENSAKVKITGCTIIIDLKELTNSSGSSILGDSITITTDLILDIVSSTEIDYTYNY